MMSLFSSMRKQRLYRVKYLTYSPEKGGAGGGEMKAGKVSNGRSEGG